MVEMSRNTRNNKSGVGPACSGSTVTPDAPLEAAALHNNPLQGFLNQALASESGPRRVVRGDNNIADLLITKG